MATPDARLISIVAAIAGTYLLLSAAGLLRRGVAETFMADLGARPASAHTVGAVAFFVGASLLALALAGRDTLSILVGLTGVWWMLEGAVTLAAPHLLHARTDAARHLRRMNLVAIPMGLLLLALSAAKFLEILP